MDLKSLKRKLSELFSKILPVVKKYWPIALIVLLVAVFFYPVFLKGLVPIPGDFIVGTYFPWLDYKWGYSVGVPVKNPITSDVVSVIYPLRSYAVNVLKSGHLPLWNPFMFAGTPLLADFPAAVLSPTMVFYFLLPKIWAWTAQIMSQPLLAAVFTYLLLRNLGLKKLESLFGGIFYAFSAFNIIWMEWNTDSLAAAFIPLLILFLDKYIKTNRLLWGVLLSFGICLQIFSGYPLLVIFTMMALCVFLLFHLKEMTKIKAFHIFLFVLLGVLLSSVVFIPGLELVLSSQRRHEILNSDLVYLPWQNLITLLAPDYFGNPATYNYSGVGNYAINSAYSGLVVLCLAIIGALNNWKKKEIKFFVVIFFAALLLALPTPFAKMLFNSPIPGISSSSNTRILVLSNLSMAVLAGFGASVLFKKSKPNHTWAIFIPLTVLSGVFVLTFFRGNMVSIRNMVFPIGLSFLTIFLVFIRDNFFRSKRLRFFLVTFLCLVATAELFRYGWKYTPFSSPDLVFPDTPVLTFLRDEERPFRISPGDVIPMNMWVPYNIESISGYDALYPIWWARLLGVINSGDPKNFTFSYYAPFSRYENSWFDLLNNKYLFVYVPKKSGDKNPDLSLFDRVEKSDKFEKVFQDKSVAIYKNNNAMPRAFFVSDWQNVPDEEALSLLIDPNFPFRKKITIDTETDLKKSNELNSKVFYSFYSPEKSILSVKTNTEGFLFVSDEWYPGWIAKVDGVEKHIYRADFAFRAVPVAAGVHTVEFSYEPKSLKIGIAASLASLTILAILYLVKGRK